MQQIVESPKVAAGVTAVSATVGVTSLFDVISGTLSIVATSTAIVLTCVLIYTHIKKSKLEIAILEKKRRKYDD